MDAWLSCWEITIALEDHLASTWNTWAIIISQPYLTQFLAENCKQSQTHASLMADRILSVIEREAWQLGNI